MDDQRDFFISYAGADQVWAEWIAWRLEAAGHTTRLQAWDFPVGSDFVHLMEQALRDDKRLLAVLSPAYRASQFGEAEWRPIFAKDPSGELGLLIPVRVAKMTVSGLLATRVHVDLVGLPEAEATERLLAAVRQGPRPGYPPTAPVFPGAAPPAELGVQRPFPGRQPAIFNVPPRNPHFTGRSDLLNTLRRQLAETRAGAVVQASAMHGLGGVGKTQLAVEYAHRFAADYELIWWVPAEQPAAISRRLAVLARRLRLPEVPRLEKPELPRLEEQVQVLFDELGGRDRWLLVYDNATDPQSLDGLRPPGGGGQVLITSRNPAWDGIAATVPVDVLDRQEAVGFLRHRLGGGEPVLSQLADVLGDLPLALEQAAAFMQETSSSPSDYLELFRDRAPELLELGTPSHYEQTVAATWTLALQQLRGQTPVAEDLLSLCAFLAPDGLPRALLTEHPDAIPRRLAAAANDRLALRQAIGALRRYSLITVTDDALRIHRLVQAVTRHALTSAQQKKWATASVRLVLAGFPEHPDNADAWPSAAGLLSHALTVSSHAAPIVTDLRATIILLTRVGVYLWGRAEYAQAGLVLERALNTADARVGPDDPDRLTARHHLATVLRDQGRLGEAKAEYEAVLERRRDVLGADHPDTLTTRHFLASVLRREGELTQAKAEYEAVLERRRDVLGADHPDTLTTRHNLAFLLEVLGQYSAAEAELREVADRRRRVLGADHPDTLNTRHSLAYILQAQGRLNEAEAEYQAVLAIQRRTLGDEHPSTLNTHHNLALVLQTQGRLKQAEAEFRAVMEGRRRVLGADHPDTLTTRHSLAYILQAQGRLNEAEAEYRAVLAVQQRTLGDKHPSTLGTRHNLASLLQARQRFEEAEAEFRAVMEGRRRVLGADHPHTLDSRHALAYILQVRGQLDEAEAEYRAVLAVQQRTLGDKHPSTLGTRHNLASLLQARQRFERPDHPDDTLG